VTGISSRRAGLAPKSEHVEFVVVKVAPGQVIITVIRFYPVNIIKL
jgi:hypothetical protein